MGILKTAVGVVAGVVTLNIVKDQLGGNKMVRQVRVPGHLRKVKGRGSKVRVRGHLMKSPKKK